MSGPVAWTLAGVVLVGQYVVRCAIWPFAKCWFCKGEGRKYQNKATKKAWRNCRWCGGTGRRRRIGRAAWAHFSKARKRART